MGIMMLDDINRWVDSRAAGKPKPTQRLKHLPKMEPATAAVADRDKQPQREKRAGSSSKKNPKRKETGDRFKVLNTFVDCTISELSRSEIAVWLILYRDTRDGSVLISQNNIAKRAGATVRGTQKAIDKLIASGLVRVIFQGGINRGPSRYKVDPLTNRSS